jgi:hypothetical protein
MNGGICHQGQIIEAVQGDAFVRLAGYVVLFRILLSNRDEHSEEMDVEIPVSQVLSDEVKRLALA